MKIDSPTFLTETTFISASVQFSSGSQKFGNTSDDIHQFTGSVSFGGPVTASSNISGSASSVGSFGTLKSLPKSQGGAEVDIISEVYSSYQKRSNHARYEPMILKNIISGTGFVPVELVQSTGSGEYHVTHGEVEVYLDQTNTPLRFHFHSHWNQTYWYRTSISVISKDTDHRNVPIYFANKDGKGYMLIGDDKFNRWSGGYVFMKYAVKTNYDDGFDQLLDIDIGSLATNFSDYTVEKTHDENYYSNLGRVKSTSTNYDGYHTIGKFLGVQDTGYARVRITRGLTAIAEFEVGGAYQRWNGRLISTRGYTSFNNFFTSFRVQDSGSVSYLQVSTVGQNGTNAEATLIASDGNFKLLPWEATGSAGGGATRLEVPLSRHEPFTIVNQDLTLQGGTYADGNVSGSSTSTGSFGNFEILGTALPTKVGANTLNISNDAADSFANLQIAIQGSDHMGMVMHEDGTARAGVYYDNVPNNLVLRTNANSFRITNADNQFSGSATSTGSFGTLRLKNNVMIGEFGNSNFIFAREGNQPFGGGNSNIGIGNDVLGDQGPTTGNNNIAMGNRSLRYVSSGDSNIALGSYALNYVTSTDGNIGIGLYAGHYMRGGADNIFIGRYSGYGGVEVSNYTSVNYNIGIGFKALHEVLTSGNVGIGYEAGFYASSGSSNTFIGHQSGKGSSSAPYSTGGSNTAVGYQALDNFTTGERNVVIGLQAGYDITTSSRNSFLGYRAGYNTDANDNVAIGNQAGFYNVTGVDNVAIGAYSMQGASGNSHGSNVAIGRNSLFSITTANSVVAVGKDALYSNTTGTNTAVGYQALKDSTTNTQNTALGYNAGQNLTANNNVAIGHQATDSGTSATGNVSVGYRALRYNVTGDYNIAIGAETLQGVSGQSHSNNVAIGHQAGKLLTTGASNVLIGHGAGDILTSGGANVIIGQSAGDYIQTGTSNTVVGFEAFSYGATDAVNNVFLGRGAGNTNFGSSNVGIGYAAFGQYTQTSGGDAQVFIGYNAGEVTKGGQYNTACLLYTSDAADE